MVVEMVGAVREAAMVAAAKAVGAQGEVRGPVTWERGVVVARGQGRMERAAAAARAVEATVVARAAVVRVAAKAALVLLTPPH